MCYTYVLTKLILKKGNSMNLKEEIEKYTPYNKQEQEDRNMMLEYLNTFEDCLTRNNRFGHFTASAIVVNPARDKILFAYHNIYKSWAWLGGHADGEENLLEVALREAKEETSIEQIKPISNEILGLEVIHVQPHIKREKFVSAHVHLNITYLFEADDTQQIHNKPDENKEVGWLPITKLEDYVSEKVMLPIYHKLIEKMEKSLL